MNSNRPFKPNLPNLPKLSKLPAPMRLPRTYFFFSLPDSVVNHSINQYEIGPFLTASQAPNGLLIDMGMVKKGFSNEPLKAVTMERMRVKEFVDSLCEDYGWVNLAFLYGFSLNILSGSSLHFVGIMGIYTRVGMECKESGFSKQSWLATWTRGLTELRVPAAR